MMIFLKPFISPSSSSLWRYVFSNYLLISLLWGASYCKILYVLKGLLGHQIWNFSFLFQKGSSWVLRKLNIPFCCCFKFWALFVCYLELDLYEIVENCKFTKKNLIIQDLLDERFDFVLLLVINSVALTISNLCQVMALLNQDICVKWFLNLIPDSFGCYPLFLLQRNVVLFWYVYEMLLDLKGCLWISVLIPCCEVVLSKTPSFLMQ